jgi:tRNA (cytidine/uridine-2'-O-)-methyltransferase
MLGCPLDFTHHGRPSEMRVVLVHPQIPQNTGSIARTCAATCTPLHLIHPLAFTLDEKRIRRAGLDYWPFVELHEHQSWPEFHNSFNSSGRMWAFTKFSTRSYHTVSFQPNDMLIFGSESSGLPESVYQDIPEEQRLCLPMPGTGVRSLNLSNAVSIALYESLRQTGVFD